MLRVEGLNVHYGGIHALKNVTLHVPEGKVVTLVGANGAGKSANYNTGARSVFSNVGLPPGSEKVKEKKFYRFSLAGANRRHGRSRSL